ncbi:MAG: hypothetical protein HUU02_03390 [Bacteroidetes bacterium]|nr:hypothetical protein [Bacteroidota bacterium]
MSVTEILTRRTDDERYPSWYLYLFVAAVVVLFANTHAPINFVMSWYDRVLTILLSSGYITQITFRSMLEQKDAVIVNVIVPVRTWSFFTALIIAAVPLLRDIARHVQRNGSIYTDRRTYTALLIPFGILCLLTFPSQLGLGGNMYARMSLEPLSFNDSKLWFYQRLLMPSIAYLLMLKGPVLYFVFSLITTIMMYLLVLLFFRTRGITLSGLELVSIGSCSFMMTQLQIPGYTEQLAIIFLLLLFIVPTGTMGRMSLVVFSLLAHEISIVPLVFVALLYFTGRERAMMGVIIGFYVTFWIASFGGDIAQLLSVRNVYGKSGLQWAMEFPLRLVSGIALSYKLLWIPIAVAAVRFQSERWFIIGLSAIAVGFTLIGVDTSRLMGFALLALLTSLYLLKREHPEVHRWYPALLSVNIIVPSFFIGTNIGIALVNGFYETGSPVGTVVLNGLYQMIYLGVVLR